MSNHTDADEASVSDHNVRREGDRRRAAKLRERREQAGQIRISAWVPRERASYARHVLHGAAAGTNALPSDPEQQVNLDAAMADAAKARAELEEARIANDRHAEQARLAQEATLARVEVAEQGREEATRELAAARAEAETVQAREQAAQEATDALRGELARIKGQKGWRGVLLRLAGA